MTELPPFVLYFVAAALVFATRGLARQFILLATPIATGLYLWYGLDAGTEVAYGLMNYELILLRADKLSLLFGTVAGLVGSQIAFARSKEPFSIHPKQPVRRAKEANIIVDGV